MLKLISPSSEIHLKSKSSCLLVLNSKLNSTNSIIPGVFNITALKAAETVLKTTSIMPGNVQNQTINNIVNIQNNQTLSPSVSNAIGSMFKNEDEDLIEAEVIDG